MPRPESSNIHWFPPPFLRSIYTSFLSATLFHVKTCLSLHTHSVDRWAVNLNSSKPHSTFGEPEVQYTNHINGLHWLQPHRTFLVRRCSWDCSAPLVGLRNRADFREQSLYCHVFIIRSTTTPDGWDYYLLITIFMRCEVKQDIVCQCG